MLQRRSFLATVLAGAALLLVPRDSMGSDDTAMLQALLDQGGSVVFPAGDHVVSKTLKVKSNTALSAYGATLLTYIPGLGDSGTSVPTLMVDGVQNVSIAGLAIDGRRDAFAHTEYKAGICVNNSSTVDIQDCDLFGCKGDGLILFSRLAGHRNLGITVTNTAMHHNYRLGCAITDVTGGLFEGCTFDLNSGTSPMGGVDIEPDSDAAWIQDLTFRNCGFDGNGNAPGDDGAGINISLRAAPTNPQGGIRFENCTANGNMISGVMIYHAYDTVFTDCDVSGNQSNGYLIDKGGDVAIWGGSITQNAVHGISATRTSGPVALKVGSVQIVDNSRGYLNHYDGVHLTGDIIATIADSTISGNRYGVWTDGSAIALLKNNDLSGNSAGETYPPVATPTPTNTPTPTRAPTQTPTQTSAPTKTPTPTPTKTPSPTPTPKKHRRKRVSTTPTS